jgi:hypothetical protein
MSARPGGVVLHPDAVEDLVKIRKCREGQPFFDLLLEAIETIPLGNKVVFSTEPGALRYGQIKRLVDQGIPAAHIRWRDRLNGFRPLFLEFDDRVVATGVALHGSHPVIPGLPGTIDYDSPADPQIQRLIGIWNAEK